MAISERDFDDDGTLNIFDQILIKSCPPGMFGKYHCEYSHPGYFAIGGTTHQIACEMGAFQPQSGMSECVVAEPGFYVEQTGSKSQSACPKGTYNPYEGMTSATACLSSDPGHYVDREGQANQIPCVKGTYNPNVGSESHSNCIPANEGHFVGASGQANQIQCLRANFKIQVAVFLANLVHLENTNRTMQPYLV